jgi:16S rRNA G966 N2-methylase RsmD
MRFAGKLPDGAYDVVFADPPYTIDYAAQLVALFRRRPFGRILSVEHRADLKLHGDSTRRYGDTAITFCHAP